MPPLSNDEDEERDEREAIEADRELMADEFHVVPDPYEDYDLMRDEP